MLHPSQNQHGIHRSEVTVQDKCRFLVSNMEHYYSLALLLTASEEDARHCFVAGLDSWSKAQMNLAPVSVEAAHAWIRRALVECALRICDPDLGRIARESESNLLSDEIPADWSPWVVAITRLDPFERFVFVLSVLESYSDKECSDLLHCRPEEIAESRVLALSLVASGSQAMLLDG
jgi:hypothetical protein